MECHFYHTGVCKKGNQCNFRHTGKPKGECLNEKCPVCSKTGGGRAGRKEREERGTGGTRGGRKEERKEEMEVEEGAKKEAEKEVVKKTEKEPEKWVKAPMPKWEEKDIDPTMLEKVKPGRIEDRPEKIEREERPVRPEREERRGHGPRERRGGHREERGRGPRDYDARRGEVEGRKEQEVYVPQGGPVDDRLIEIRRKEDVAYQAIADAKTKAFATRLMQAHQDLKIFQPLERVFQEKLSLDLMFILDCTGSMSSWIKAAKQQLYNIVDFVMQEHEGAKIFISVVAYRDICDKEKNIEVLPFTNQKDVALSFISKLTAMGGGDTPEDICGGFEAALKQDWKSSAKYALLITDAPCHGKKYHDVDDSYKDGDPKGRDPEKQLISLAELGINVYGIKITKITDKMFRIFSDAYQTIAKKPMPIADLGQSVGSFGFFVANTVTATLSSSVVNSDVSFIKRALKEMKELKKNNILTVEQQVAHLMKISELPSEVPRGAMDVEEERTIYANKFVGEPNWKNLQNSERHDVIEHTYFIVKDKGVPINWRKPLLQNSQIHSQVVIAKDPFAEGGMRYAFYGYDLQLNQKLVVKENKKLKYNNLETMSRDLELVYICQHLVNTFNSCIVENVPDTRLLLTFVHTFLIEIPKLKKLLYAENFIEGVYEKFNNNAGWQSNKASESSFISQAFSHYSYQATEGYLLVVDLQGASGMLTDPQIHCLDNERFGAGNLGYEGILKFFFTHKCNPYCKQLGLVSPKQTGEIPKDFNFYTQEIPKPVDPKKQVFTICDLCRGAYKTNAGFVYSKRMEDQLKYCKPCDDQRKSTMRDGKCEWCSASFRSSEFWFKMMRTDFPTLCGDCRKKRREMWRKQLEVQEEKKKA